MESIVRTLWGEKRLLDLCRKSAIFKLHNIRYHVREIYSGMSNRRKWDAIHCSNLRSRQQEERVDAQMHCIAHLVIVTPIYVNDIAIWCQRVLG
jgi:hypothetical protein